MKIFAFVAAAALFSGIIACDGDTPVSTGEMQTEDSALALSVMTARGDTLGAPVENELVDEVDFTDVKVRSSAPAPPPPQRVAVSISPPAVASKQAPAITEREQQPVVAAAAPAIPSETEESRMETPPTRPAIAERSAKAKRTGTISSGSALLVFTNQKVCDRAGTFRAIVSQTVRGSNGAVIPAGAQATTEITSTDKWGAGIGVRVTSVRFEGTSYPVSSRPVYVLPESDGCIPAQARIEVETKDALQVEALR